MKSLLPGYLEYGKTYEEQVDRSPPQPVQVNPARLSTTRAQLLLITLLLLAMLIFVIYQLASAYPVSSRYVARIIDQQAVMTSTESTNRLTAMVEHYRTRTMQIADNPHIRKLLVAGDDTALRVRENSLRNEFPKALNVQILPAGSISINMNSSPPMSYAGLDQIHLSEASPQMPPMEVHLFDSPQRHINIVHRIMDPANKIVTGHIMLSLPVDSLQDTLRGQHVNGYLEIQQIGARGDPVTMVAQGDINNRKDDPVRVIPIAGSRWQIAYWTPASNQVYLFSINVAVLCAALLISTGLLTVIVILFRRLINDTLPATE